MLQYRSWIAALLLVSGGCSFKACSGQTDDGLAQDLPRLSEALGLPLPAQTQVIWAQRQEGMDDMTRAKLRMDKASFSRLAPKLPLAPEQLGEGSGELGPNHGGWDPEGTPGMRSGEAALPGARFLHYGFAEQDGLVTLFVVNFGT
jgi:hypothetical protein